tara:strand:- start:2 stop:181 length:180 start_codon:yes stop_codon:yes gene_type:complete
MGAVSRLIASTLTEAFGSTATKVDDTVEALGDVSVKAKVEDTQGVDIAKETGLMARPTK